MSPTLHAACPYCGRLCAGDACLAHADLPALERTPLDTRDADARNAERAEHWELARAHERPAVRA